MSFLNKYFASKQRGRKQNAATSYSSKLLVEVLGLRQETDCVRDVSYCFASHSLVSSRPLLKRVCHSLRQWMDWCRMALGQLELYRPASAAEDFQIVTSSLLCRVTGSPGSRSQAYPRKWRQLWDWHAHGCCEIRLQVVRQPIRCHSLADRATICSSTCDQQEQECLALVKEWQRELLRSPPYWRVCVLESDKPNEHELKGRMQNHKLAALRVATEPWFMLLP